MPIPHVCPNPACPRHSTPGRRWFVHFGSYETLAHGTIRRYRCRACGTTMSDQTESLHYFAKRHLPLRAIKQSLLAGSSMREIATRYQVSPMAIHNAVVRLGRQAIAAQSVMLSHIHDRQDIVFDGLRSCVTSQDFPCDITTVVDRTGETILTMVHAIFRRGGRMTAKQRRRCIRKYRRWRPAAGSVSGAISLVGREIWDYLRPSCDRSATIDTDENPMYRAMLDRDRVMGHFRRVGLVQHIETAGSAPRTIENRLFPVNYVDRLVRHRLKEHTRETIAIGRNAVMQMHRAWIFAWDHNSRRPHRVRHPEGGVHAVQGSVDKRVIEGINRGYYRRRIRPVGCMVPASMAAVWLGTVVTPPVRWKVGQRGTSVRIPAYARRDLATSSSTGL